MSRKMPAAEAVGEITAEQLEAELRRERYKRSFAFTLRNTIYMLITVAAVAVLVAVLLMPVLQIYGTSMAPTLNEGEIVLSVKSGEFKTGDIMAFYYNNNILVNTAYRYITITNAKYQSVRSRCIIFTNMNFIFYLSW